MQAAGGPRGACAPSSRGFLLKALPCSSWGAGAGWGQPRTDFPVPRACGATRQRPPGLRLLLSFAFGAPVCTHSVPTAGLASNSRSETYLPLLRPGITGAEKCDGQTPSEGDDRDRRTRVTEGLRIAPQQQVLRVSAAAADQSHSAQRALSAPASAAARGLEGRPRGSRSTQTRNATRTGEQRERARTPLPRARGCTAATWRGDAHVCPHVAVRSCPREGGTCPLGPHRSANVAQATHLGRTLTRARAGRDRPAHGTHTHTSRHTLMCTPVPLVRDEDRDAVTRTHTEPLTNTQTGPHIQVAAAWLPHRHVVSSPSVSSGKEKRTGSVQPDLQEPRAPQPPVSFQGGAQSPLCARNAFTCMLPSADSRRSAPRGGDVIPCHGQTRGARF